jgi:hypothetical protein
MMPSDHFINPRQLTGQVGIVRLVAHAGIDQQRPIPRKRAGCRQYNSGSGSQSIDIIPLQVVGHDPRHTYLFP